MARRTLESLGRLVREKRGEKRLRETAKEIGISAPTLIRIEAGRIPDVATFGKICTWLGVDPGEFIGGPQPAKSKSKLDGPIEVSVHLKAHREPDRKTLAALSEMISLVAKMQAPSQLE